MTEGPTNPYMMMCQTSLAKLSTISILVTPYLFAVSNKAQFCSSHNIATPYVKIFLTGPSHCGNEGEGGTGGKEGGLEFAGFLCTRPLECERGRIGGIGRRPLQ